MRPTILATAGFLLIAVTRAATAQLFDRMSNPRVTVTLNHPPDLGLNINQVAFGPSSGQRANEVVQALQSDFAASGIRVLDQVSFQDVLARHQFVYTGFVDPASAVAMGKFLGPTAVLMIDVVRASTEQQRSSTTVTDNKNVKHTTWHSKTSAQLRVRIRAVDLVNGQALPPQVIFRDAEKENTAEEKCCANYPSEREVFQLALRDFVADAHRRFLVWAEPQQIYFFDDKECRMGVAHELLKGGDIQGAERQSAENIETCKATPNINEKQLAHSYYNVGAIAFLEGNFDKAADYFERAQRVKDIGITTDAIALLKRARQSFADLQGFVAKRAEVLGALAPDSGRGGPTRLTPLERLKALDTAYKSGLITKDEYDRKKAEILKEM